MADSNIIGINGNVLFNTVGQPFYCVASTGESPIAKGNIARFYASDTWLVQQEYPTSAYGLAQFKWASGSINYGTRTTTSPMAVTLIGDIVKNANLANSATYYDVVNKEYQYAHSATSGGLNLTAADYHAIITNVGIYVDTTNSKNLRDTSNLYFSAYFGNTSATFSASLSNKLGQLTTLPIGGFAGTLSAAKNTKSQLKLIVSARDTSLTTANFWNIGINASVTGYFYRP